MLHRCIDPLDLGDHTADALAKSGEFGQLLINFSGAIKSGRGNLLVFGISFLQFVDNAAQRLQARHHVA